MSYKIGLALPRGGKLYHGRVEIQFTLVNGNLPDDLFVDYNGQTVTCLVINGTIVSKGNPFHDHRIYFDKEYL